MDTAWSMALNPEFLTFVFDLYVLSHSDVNHLILKFECDVHTITFPRMKLNLGVINGETTSFKSGRITGNLG